jgi:hypothetical protein
MSRTTLSPVLAVIPLNQLLAPRITSAGTRSARATIAYTPRANAPGSIAAAASATGVVTRFMREANIANIDVSPASIRHWRIRHTWLIDAELKTLEAKIQRLLGEVTA